MRRPAETIQATVSSIVGAFLLLWGAFHHGLDFSRLSDPEVAGAITLLLGYVSLLVTRFTAKKQRAGQLVSGPDGAVVPASPPAPPPPTPAGG